MTRKKKEFFSVSDLSTAASISRQTVNDRIHAPKDPPLHIDAYRVGHCWRIPPEEFRRITKPLRERGMLVDAD